MEKTSGVGTSLSDADLRSSFGCARQLSAAKTCFEDIQLVMGGCMSILFHFHLALTTYVFASSPHIESLSWFPNHDTLSDTNAIIIIIALVGGIVLMIAFIILHLTRPRIEPEMMDSFAEVAIYPSMPHTQPLLPQTKQGDNVGQGKQLLTIKTDNSDGIIMEATQWANDETPAPGDGQKVNICKEPSKTSVEDNHRLLVGAAIHRAALQAQVRQLRGKASEAVGIVGDRMVDTKNIATAVEKMPTEMPEAQDFLKPASKTESSSSTRSTRTESHRRESERLDSERTESSKMEVESNETNGSKDLSASEGRDTSSRSSSRRRTRTSSWGWMRSPHDALANRPSQVNTSTFQIPSWMNVENTQSGTVTDNFSGLPQGFPPPPFFAAQPLPLAPSQPMPQIVSPSEQHQVRPLLHNPIVPPTHYQQSPPFVGVPLIWTPQTTQPTQHSSATDSDKKEPSSERVSSSN